MKRLSLKFDIDDAQQAADEWGFDCGPASLCAILDKTPETIRPHLREFEKKRYTNPSLMASILHDLQVPFFRIFEQVGRCHTLRTPRYPSFGLVRIQWDGPWCDPGRPVKARYRHTHWVARRLTTVEMRGYPDSQIFDVNAMCVGGWIPWSEWVNELIPWLLKQCEAKASGQWWPTHCWDIDSLFTRLQSKPPT